MKIYGLKNKTLLLRSAFIGILLYTILSPSITYSGEWRVTPIRLDLGREAKSGVITVINEGSEKLQVQIKAFEWMQDAEAKDIYTETNDIIFFPKIIVFEKNEERIIRAGIKILATKKEKTYRLFIEEIPEPKKAEGVNVSFAIRFGVPIFVKPLKEETKGEIGKIEMSKAIFSAIVKNTGNMHFIINSINVKGKNLKGKEIFSKELSGWYLLSGASRLYTTQILQEICKDIVKLGIEVKTDRFNVDSTLDVDKAMCLP
jgi:fimbrial chaperone protein